MSDTYFERAGVRATHLKALRQSPLHYRFAVDNPQAGRTASRTALQANHCAILEPERFATDYAAWTGKVRRGKAWDAWQQDNPGVTGLSMAEHSTAVAIAQAVHQHPAAGPIVLEAQHIEHAHQWTDHRTGLKCLMRADLIRSTSGGRMLLGDVKAVASADVKAVTSQCYRLGWDIQMAHYLAGVRDEFGPHVDISVALICVESAAPYDVSVIYLSREVIDCAAAERRRLMDTVKRCTESGEWPGRHTSPEVMDLPPWLEPELVDSREES